MGGGSGGTGRAGGRDPGSQAAEDAGISGAQRHGDTKAGRADSGPVILAPGGIPGAGPTGTMTWPAGAPGRPAEAALAPCGPIRAAPASMATATLAVQAGHVRRFSIPCPP